MRGFPLLRASSGAPVLFLAAATVALGTAPRVACAADDRPPNVVLVVIDTLRSDHLGCYGYERGTSPFIDELAAEGVLFEHCYSAASWTFPACMSILSGLLPIVHGCECGTERLSEAIVTLPQYLARQGYYCAGVVSNPHLDRAFGFARGFHDYDDRTAFVQASAGLFRADAAPTHEQVNDIVTGNVVTQRAVSLLGNAVKRDQPFFLFVLYFDPHDSYVPPARYVERFDKGYDGPMDGTNVAALRGRPPAKRDLEHLVARYDGEIAYVDDQLRRLVEAVDRVARDETITIVVSDHGEAFGEHGHMLHGNGVHREEMWTPMIWRAPGRIASGRRVREPVSNLDVLATLAEMVPIRNPRPYQGRSLAPALRGDPLAPAPVLGLRSRPAVATMRHVVVADDRFRLHARFEHSPLAEGAVNQLFDIAKDPWERNPIVDRHQTSALRMRRALDETWRASARLYEQYQSEAPTTAARPDKVARRHIESVGYMAGRLPGRCGG
ncbi:MAG: hypothetical protein CMJ18_12805 [Phycisphaeraceae bacterium]|nr:hypothetical protein [Phycisphaeraceae bacterium]